MNLTFCGGARIVTGANYLLESGGKKILVDCGLEQGSKYAERWNFEPFPYDPAEIEAVFITHAHMDHVGRLPKLVRDGFRGTIYSTSPTRDFAELILLDSDHILAREAEREKKEPISSVEEIRKLMENWKGIHYHAALEAGGFKADFFDAGHILGSSSIKISAEGKSVVFSGDLGNTPAPIIRPTEPIPSADYCLIESTYGGRIHDDEGAGEREKLLKGIVREIYDSKSTLLIPAFAMERTQDLLYMFNELVHKGEIPRIPVYIDSPLAIKLTSVYKKYEDYFNGKAHEEVRSGDDILNFPGLHLTLTTEQSKEINSVPGPKIIIAGSGMSHGGRILHHEIRYLPDPNSVLLIVGFQARGSLGRELLEGKEAVHIFGEEVAVNCQIKKIPGFSAHADQPKLLNWLKNMQTSLKKVFVVQGEEDQAEALAEKIKSDLGLAAEIPMPGEKVTL